MTKNGEKRKDIFYQAQSILAIRDHSESEMRTKLSRKKFLPAEIEHAIDVLKKENLLNDEAFAMRYAEVLVTQKPVGPRFVSMKLAQRGIQGELASTAITETFETHSEQDLAQQAIETWNRIHPNVEKKKEKLFRFLASRGFSQIVITEVLEDV